MRKVWLVLGGVGVVVAGGGAVYAAPRVLPEIPGFEVRRVEISGLSLLESAEVVRAAGVSPDQSIWEDADIWKVALESHPVIEQATIARRPPGTLLVEVREKRPVALIEDGVLMPVTASGERLPVIPARASPDLPIVRGMRAGEEVPLPLLAEVDRLARLDPEFFAEVSEIQARDEDGAILRVRHRQVDVLMPAGIAADRLVELRSVLADVEERRGDGQQAEGVVRVDLRYADQVVVRMPSSVQKP